jgi:hypothetical protein
MSAQAKSEQDPIATKQTRCSGSQLQNPSYNLWSHVSSRHKFKTLAEK